MTEAQINFCPFCGNELKIKEESCPFCNRDISLLFSDHVLETNTAGRILGCLSALPKDFGRYVLASVLRGSASLVILDNDLDQNPFYGDLGKLSKKDIISMIDALIEKGFIDMVVKEEEIHNIRISDRGEQGLEGKDIAWVPLPFPLYHQLEPIFTPEQKAVIPELRSMRRNLAHSNDIPPYMVFNDDTLKDIALKLPSTVEELEMVKGIKEVKAKKYSKEILETVQWAREDFGRRLGLDEDEGTNSGVGEAVSDIFDELEEMKSILPIVESDGSAEVSLASMLHPVENEKDTDGTEVFPMTEKPSEEESDLVMKIPVRRIAISKETGEELNICDKCGGYYHISLEFCPHCDDLEETDEITEEPDEEGDGESERDGDEVDDQTSEDIDEIEDLAEEEAGEIDVIELGEGSNDKDDDSDEGDENREENTDDKGDIDDSPDDTNDPEEESIEPPGENGGSDDEGSSNGEKTEDEVLFTIELDDADN